MFHKYQQGKVEADLSLWEGIAFDHPVLETTAVISTTTTDRPRPSSASVGTATRQ